MDAGQAAAAMKRRAIGLPAAVCASLALAIPGLAATATVEDRLRAAWVGSWVVLRTAAHSDCGERYTDNRLQGSQPSSNGIHHFAPGELGRVDNLHLQRARIDLLVSLIEPLRVEIRDGPFQLYEHLECRVELEMPVPRSAVRQGALGQLRQTVNDVLEKHVGRPEAAESKLWNRRRVEPLPADHEQRLAAYHAWKAEQLYGALRDRLAQALDRAADLAAGVDRSVAYAQGLTLGARQLERDRFYSTDCEELPDARFSPRREKAPKELDDRQEQDWKDGFEDGQLLLFEIWLARRIERCLP